MSEPVHHAKAGASSPPNIVFIVTDDQGPWAIDGFGHPQARTPNLLRLCREGARFSRYFNMSAVCSPARACLLTGRYSTDVCITDYISPQMGDVGLDPSHPTWSRMLADGAYATGLIGKWHLGGSDHHHPTRHGYSEFTGFRYGGKVSRNPRVEVDGSELEVPGYTSDVLTDFAIDFIHRHAGDRFALSLHYWAPHANAGLSPTHGDRTWHPLSDADWAPFRDLEPAVPNPDYPKLDIPRVQRMTREYLGSVHSVDRNVGRLMSTLDRLGLTDDTAVVFTSDNGFNLGHNGIWHKGNGWWILTDNRGDRPNLYDNSLRVPMILRWPARVRPGTVIDRTVTSLDWFPTLASMATLSPPEGARLRGRCFLPLLDDPSSTWDDDLFAQYSMRDRQSPGAKLRTYRTPEWKLVRDFNSPDRDELYHVARDPDEHRNVITSRDREVRSQRDQLQRRLDACMERIDDPAISLR